MSAQTLRAAFSFRFSLVITLIITVGGLSPCAWADPGQNGWHNSRSDWSWRWSWFWRPSRFNWTPVLTPAQKARSELSSLNDVYLTPTPTCTVTPHNTPYPSVTSTPPAASTVYSTPTPTCTVTPHMTATQSYPTATATPYYTTVPSYTSTPEPSPTPQKLPCLVFVSRRGSHPTSRWFRDSSPFPNVNFPSTVSLTIGGQTVKSWNMDPCNRQYAKLNVCAAWRSDPPRTYTHQGVTYAIIGANNAIGGECKLTVGQLVSPLVIDFRMDGVLFTEAPTARFNYGKGHEPTYWIRNSSDVGFLAIDKNRNRRIDHIDELFGDKTANDEGKRPFATGFEALAIYDSDRNGEINKRDEAFERLRIWFDRDNDGKTDRGELQRLGTMGIEAISVKYEQILEFADQNGNISQARGMVFLKGNPPSGVGIYDVYFARVPRELRR